MTKLHIKNGIVIDPKNKRNGKFDLLVENGVVSDVLSSNSKIKEAKTIDATNLIVTPGFVDLHVHLREPGFEYKESIETGTKSASFGGFTSVCCMANTNPVNDNPLITKYILDQAQKTSTAKVYPVGAITKGLKGEELTPMQNLVRAGCVAFSDDGITVANAQIMRMAMEYAHSLGVGIWVHAVDAHLSCNGVMNEGFLSTKLGLQGIPNAAEDVMIARDIYLAELTGCALHICHLTTAEGVELVRRAKDKGLKVTCEVSPHHLGLTDEAVGHYDTNAKMAPPLRSEKDRTALWKGIKDGVIDAIATDHAPHSPMDKEVPFDAAPCGVVGLETALGVVLTEAEKHGVSLGQIISLLTENPARIAQINAGQLKKGSRADITIFDPKEMWVVQASHFVSKSKNTPFEGKKLKGRVKMTIVDGNIVFDGK